MIVRKTEVAYLVIDWKFQFHYGMIVRYLATYPKHLTSKFQFHYGMIVSGGGGGYELRHIPISIPLWDDCEFELKDIYIINEHFNSTMG